MAKLSTDKQTDMISDNKLIADFMNVGHLYESQSSNRFNNYHNSWDDLMPVVNKCYQEHMSRHLLVALTTCNLETVYKVVVEFINEYNA